ncbi:MAG: ATP-binding cassette domain-containing protein, partial [Thermoanaerobaculia bacterium]
MVPREKFVKGGPQSANHTLQRCHTPLSAAAFHRCGRAPGDLVPSAARLVSRLAHRPRGPGVLSATARYRTRSQRRGPSLCISQWGIESPVGTYSGGMTQRLGLAVAALPQADVLLLDEPTAALDPYGLCAFYGLAVEIRKDNRTVF